MGEKKISYDYVELGAGLVKFLLAPLFFKKARTGKEKNRDDPWRQEVVICLRDGLSERV